MKKIFINFENFLSINAAQLVILPIFSEIPENMIQCGCFLG